MIIIIITRMIMDIVGQAEKNNVYLCVWPDALLESSAEKQPYFHIFNYELEETRLIFFTFVLPIPLATYMHIKS